MREGKPEVFLVAKTELVEGGLEDYLQSIGSPDWAPNAPSGGEALVEAAGRMCYRSWQAYDPSKPDATNPNVTKVREGNDVYLGNILKVGHGSILEHVSATFICKDVSRVFTHELVRHRAGCAYSQESLRYVRLTDLKFWLPPEVVENPKAVELFNEAVLYAETVQVRLADIYGIEDMKDFNKKKQLTSMFRRLAPIGLATSIMFTANIRALRHIIEMRTSPHAEIEVRVVFDEIARICKNEWPNFFQDMKPGESEYEWSFAHSKV